jgi:type I restriction enzyme M protein
MVPVSEIATPANDYNLNLPRYIDSSEPEDLHDLDAHLNGGIPNRDIEALDAYWKVFPSLRGALFKENGRPGYSDARVPSTEVKSTILSCPEFTTFSAQIKEIVDAWCATHAPMLKGLKVNDLPRRVISVLSEDLLARFTDRSLVDRYDVYQRLMDYWRETMQDDVYLIAGDGWIEAAKPRGIVEDKERKIKETPDLVIGRKKYKMDLVPPALIVARYFADEQATIDELQIAHDTAERELEEFIEENTGEDASGEKGLLVDAMNEKDKITKASVKARLNQIKEEAESDTEREGLVRCIELMEAESEAGRAAKAAQVALEEKVLARYGQLSEGEIKSLVVADKWVASVGSAIEGEVQRLTQRLASRVKELDERYARRLSELEQEVEKRGGSVAGHLRKMGLAWV